MVLVGKNSWVVGERATCYALRLCTSCLKENLGTQISKSKIDLSLNYSSRSS
jgi:hypothetical protein